MCSEILSVGSMNNKSRGIIDRPVLETDCALIGLGTPFSISLTHSLLSTIPLVFPFPAREEAFDSFVLYACVLCTRYPKVRYGNALHPNTYIFTRIATQTRRRPKRLDPNTYKLGAAWPDPFQEVRWDQMKRLESRDKASSRYLPRQSKL